MKTTRLHSDACPLCGHKVDVATAGPTNPRAIPKPNDASICIHCGGLLIFTTDLTLRAATPDEIREIMADYPEAAAMIRALDRLQPPHRA